MLNTQDDLLQERIDEPTPNGGDCSVAYYMDDHWNAVPKSIASRMEIVEFDKDGHSLYRTIGRLLKNKPEPAQA
jgi:hypothetical protein